MNRMLNTADKEMILDAVGEVIREQREKIVEELRGSDRATNLVRTVQELHIEESLGRLRGFVRALGFERSRVLEVRGIAPPWLAAVDQEQAP